MKKLITLCLIVMMLGFTGMSLSQQIAEDFIFPVKHDQITNILGNTTNPVSAEGGWFVSNNFGTNWNEVFTPVDGSYSSGGINFPFHPGMDYNRYDEAENVSDDVPVYSIADGVVIRVQSTAGNGWYILVKHDLSPSIDLAQYVLPGTNPDASIYNGSSIVAKYLHLSGNEFGLPPGDHRPPVQTITVSKGQLLGYISSDLDHLHFEICVGTSDMTGAVDGTQAGGYYDTEQHITDFGNIDPERFILDHLSSFGGVSESASIGEMEGGIAEPYPNLSQKFVDAVNNAGINATPFNNGGGAGVHLWGDLYIQDLKDEANNLWYVAVFNKHIGESGEVVILDGDWRFYWLSNYGYQMGPPLEYKGSYVYVFGDGKDTFGNAVIALGDSIEVWSFGDPNDTNARITLIMTAFGDVFQVPVGLFTFEDGSPDEEWFVWDDVNGDGGFFSPYPQVDEVEFISVFTVGSDGKATRYYQPNKPNESYFFARVVGGQIPTNQSAMHTVYIANNQTMSLNPAAVQPPINVLLTVISETQIDIDAEDPNNPAGQTTYAALVNPGNQTVAISSFPFSLTGLTPGTEYEIALRSFYNGGNSIYGSTLSATTFGGSVGVGSLTVISDPIGAEVKVNGTRWPDTNTTTPITTFAYNAGTYPVNVSLSGYDDYNTNVTIADGQTATVDVTLAVSNPGKPVTDLDLTAEPYISDVQVLDAFNGSALFTGETPLYGVPFSADSLTIVFSKTDYASWGTTVVVQNGINQAHHGVLTYNGSNPLGPVVQTATDTLDLGEHPGGVASGFVTLSSVGTSGAILSFSSSGITTATPSQLTVGIGYSGEAQIAVDFDGLAAGDYYETLTVVNAGGDDISFVVAYTKLQEEGVVVFTDDYERSSLGDDYGHTGDAYISGNKLFVPINNKVVTVPTAGNLLDVSLVYDWSFSASSGDRKFVMWTRRQASGYSGYQSDQDGYQVVLKRDSRKVIFAKWVDGVEYNMGVFTGFNPDPGRYHLSVIGNTLQFYNEPGGTPVSITVVDTGYGGVGALPAGEVGFQQNGDNCTVDNLEIISEPGSMQNGTTLTCDPLSFDFGETDTTTTISVESNPMEGVDWSISYTPLWLTTDISAGTTTSQVVLSIDRDGLSPGTYSDTLRFVADDSLCAFPVSMTVPVDNAALFSDDFSAGLGGWTTIEGSVPTILGGELYFNSSGVKSTSVVTSPSSLTDAVITFDWRSEGSYQGNDNSMIYLRVSGNSHVKALIKQDGNSGKKVVIISQNNGVEKGLATQYLDLQPGRYRFSVFGSTATFEHVSGNPGSALSLTATDGLIGSLGAGSVGLGVGHEKAYYDNVVVGTEIPLAKAVFVDHNVFDDVVVPTAYALEQNYPNPFNPSTNIRFAIPRDGHVTIAVFDITGRLVVKLVDAEMIAGVHMVTFDGRDLTSGLYFVRMRSVSFLKTNKMTLIK